MLKEQCQLTISEHQFAKLCAAAWSQAEVMLQQPGVRRVSAANVVLSRIVSGLYGHFAIEPDRLDRRHGMSKIHRVMADGMQPPFDYAPIVGKFTKKAEQQYGGEPPAQKLPRAPFVRRRKLGGGAGNRVF